MKEDILNVDECCLFYQVMPNKTLSMALDNVKIERFQKRELLFL